MTKNLTNKAIAFLLLTSCACAQSVEVRNDTQAPIRVFLRAHDKGAVFQKYDVSAGETSRLEVDRYTLGMTANEYYYDLIASKNLKDDINPDWRLLAGGCGKLHANQDITVVINESVGGLKTSCRVVRVK